jgi:hypothetical protein
MEVPAAAQKAADFCFCAVEDALSRVFFFLMLSFTLSP